MYGLQWGFSKDRIFASLEFVFQSSRDIRYVADAVAGNLSLIHI